MSSKLFAFNVSKKSERLEETDYEWVGDHVARGCHIVGHCTDQNYGNSWCGVGFAQICYVGGGGGFLICDGFIECP